MYNNTVYDFNMFEQNEKVNQTKIYELPSLESRRKKKLLDKLKFYGKCISAVFISGAAIGGLLFGQAKFVEYNDKAAIESRKLEECKNRNEQLKIRLNGKTDIPDAKEDAKECVETVTISSGDKAEIK